MVSNTLASGASEIPAWGAIASSLIGNDIEGIVEVSPERARRGRDWLHLIGRTRDSEFCNNERKERREILSRAREPMMIDTRTRGGYTTFGLC